MSMKLRVGMAFPAVSMTSIHGKPVRVPDPSARYGAHAYDNWNADYLLGLTADFGRNAFTRDSSVSM